MVADLAGEGFFGTTLITAPVAPSPYSTEAGPRITSMRSTIHGSLGKFTVPMPVYRRVPSNSCITDAWPLNPRAERPVPPSPGVPMKLMPGLRVTAAWTLGLLRRRTSSPLMLLVLAGCPGR